MGRLTELVGRTFDVLNNKIEVLEEENALLKALHSNSRWNIEKTEDGVKICFGEHEKEEGCAWVYYIEKPPITITFTTKR